MPDKNGPEIDPAEIKIAEEPTPEKEGQPDDAEAEDALAVIADNLSLIQKHLFALLYVAHTWRPEVTGVTYVHEVFQAIYTETDPFKEVDTLLLRLKKENDAAGKKTMDKNAKSR